MLLILSGHTILVFEVSLPSIFPFESKVTSCTESVWPLSVRSKSPVSKSHNLIVASSLAETKTLNTGWNTTFQNGLWKLVLAGSILLQNNNVVVANVSYRKHLWAIYGYWCSMTRQNILLWGALGIHSVGLRFFLVGAPVMNSFSSLLKFWFLFWELLWHSKTSERRNTKLVIFNI